MLPLPRFSSWSVILLAVCCAGLQAQNIVPSSSELSFTAPVDGFGQPALLTVTSSGAPFVVNASVNTFGVGHWLSVSPTISGTPASLIVTVNALGLSAGAYLGEVVISSSGAANTPVAVPVRLTVGGGGTGAVTVAPASLTFSGQPSGFPPEAVTLAVSSTPSGVGFATSASTSSGGNWLAVTPLTGTAPSAITVSVVTAGLAAGEYAGNILITPATGDPVNVPVTLNVSSGNVLSVSATSLQFYYQIGSFLPTSQTFDVSNRSAAPVSFGVIPSTSDGRNWLSATPLFGNTPQTVTATVNASGLGSGLYTGKINVSAPDAFNSSVDVPVSLTVSNGPLLTVGSYPARFTYQAGGAPPSAQSVFIGSTTGSLPYTATVSTSAGGAWLAVSPSSSQTPQALAIAVSPASLPPGTYSGAVSVAAAGAANSPVSIPVTLIVSSTGVLTSSLESIQMNYQIGGSNQVVAQVVGIYSSGAPVDVTAAASSTNCGGNWLRVYTTSFTTPAAVTIAVEPIGFNLPADCSGVVTFTPAGGGAALQVPVTLKVATTPLFNFTPLSLSFTAPFDGSPTTKQEVALSMTSGPGAAFSVAPSMVGGGQWLRVGPASGTTPAVLEVSADPFNLSVGTYTGSILLGSPALEGIQMIPVTFRVTSTVAATMSPASLTFTQAVGSAAPPAQTIALGVPGASLQFTATPSTGNAVGWLSVSPNTGATPNTISVAVNGTNLAPGNYTGSVTFTMPAAANSPLTVPVTLNVVPARGINSTVTSLFFSYRAGGETPAPQTVRVTATGDPVNLTATASGGSWLRVSPSTSGTPAVFQVEAVPAGLSTGTYSGSVEIAAPGVAGSPIRIPVTLSVLSAPAPALADLFNAASGLRAALAPGEILTIKGAGLGPDQPAELQLTPDGKVAATLAGTRVLFNDVPGPVLYTSAGQINVVAPYEIAALPTVRVVIEYRGVRSPAFTYQVAPVSPGLFTASSTGRGQGAILNQDSSYNSAAAPADRESVVQVFGTGDGVSIPPLETGSVTPDLRRTGASVTALVGGFNAAVVFAGPAPGAVAGLFQVNVRIPREAPSGNVPVVLVIGGVASQSGVTVAVR